MPPARPRATRPGPSPSHCSARRRPPGSANGAGMNSSNGSAVVFVPPSPEALGDAIRPDLQSGDGPDPHVVCSEIDAAGAFVEMTIAGRTPDGREASLELLVPSGMVRVIVSSQQSGDFGFRPHTPSLPGAKA